MYTLVGIDGNAFSIIGYVSNAMKDQGLKDQIDDYRKNAMSENYDHLLHISMEWIDHCNELAGYNMYDDEDYD